jgi:hypothetical protein
MKITAFLLLLLVLSLSSCDNASPDCSSCDLGNQAYNDSVVGVLLQDTIFFNSEKQYRMPKLESIGKESYVLRMGHSFSQYEQFYTLIKQRKGAELIVREFAYKRTKFDSKNVLVKMYRVKLSQKQWDSIKKEVRETCYWTNKVGLWRRRGLDGGNWVIKAYDPQQLNCAGRKKNIDFCSFDSKSKMGDLCRTIRKYAHEERLHVYKD